MLNVNGIYHSKHCGPVQILQTLPNDKYEIRFTKTGTKCIARGAAIKRGEIRDPFARLNCGVACTGDVKTKGKNGPYYNVWNSMIHRCYAVTNKRHNAYKNVTVCEEWLIFKNFLADCKTLPGFDENKFLAGELTLDKDKKQRFQTEKIYSPDTCVWLSKSENAKYQDNQMRPFKATSPDGQEFTASNITEFAKDHNLDRKHISGVLHHRTKSTQGWTFQFCEEIV